VGKDVGLGIEQEPGDRRELGLQAFGDVSELVVSGCFVGLLEHGSHRAGDHAPGRSRHEILGVAAEVHPAALPA
jgi:hypothetical protein